MLCRTMSRVLPPLGFVLALLFTPHCASEPNAEDNPADGAAAENGVVLSAATWNLGFNTEGIDFHADGGWSVTTNLGYRVTIDTGNIVLHRVALIPCPTEPTETSSWLGVSIDSAFAHEEESDPSSMETLAAADIIRPKTMEIGANAFAPVRYCQVYWLVARGMAGATAEDGLDISNRSVFLKGTWERGGVSGPLSVDTWWPGGVISDLKDLVKPNLFSTAAAESSVHFAWITITVPLGRLFDDIEFDGDSDAIVADSILDNLTMSADVTIDLQSP